MIRYLLAYKVLIKRNSKAIKLFQGSKSTKDRNYCRNKNDYVNIGMVVFKYK